MNRTEPSEDPYEGEEVPRRDEVSVDTGAPPPLRVRVLSDPGLAASHVEGIDEELAESLHDMFGIDIEVRTSVRPIRLTHDESIDVSSTAKAESAEEPQETEADIVLSLTEMPLLRSRVPLVAVVYPHQRSAVVSYPALGISSARRRLQETFLQCAARLLRDHEPLHPLPSSRAFGGWDRGPGEHIQRLHATPVLGRGRTILGMIATNTPWRTVPRLGRALALAAATGAFGIFYSNVWQMSDALSPLRLGLISLLAIGAMTWWLILGNQLWERSTHGKRLTTDGYYNLSTFVTMLIAVSALYFVLFAFILAASAVVIAPDYLSAVLEKPASPANYVDIAWFSASLGTVAGGLGASFDSHTDVGALTHRQRERGRLQESDEESA